MKNHVCLLGILLMMQYNCIASSTINPNQRSSLISSQGWFTSSGSWLVPSLFRKQTRALPVNSSSSATIDLPSSHEQQPSSLILWLQMRTNNIKKKLSFFRFRCNKVSRIVVPVVQQSTKLNWPEDTVSGTNVAWSTIAQLESGNCGYHALSNVLWVARSVEKGIKPSLSRAQLQEQYLQFMVKAFPIIVAKRRDEHSANWLDGAELEGLLKHFKGDLAVPIVILEHVPAQGLEFSEHVLQAVKVFAQDSSKLLGFVWNSGVRTDVSKMGGSHWVAFVAQHDGDTIKLYYMNSITGLDPNFSVIDNLFCNSPEQLQELIDKKKIDVMKLDLENITRNFKIADGAMSDHVFQKYVGCIEYSGKFLTEFTLDQLRGLELFAADRAVPILASLNSNWHNYVKTKKPIALNHQTKRFYAIWINPGLNANAFDVSVKSNYDSARKYGNSSLFVDGKDIRVIEPDTFFECMVHIYLVSWANYGVWPIEIQEEVSRLLVEYLLLGQKRPLMFTGGDWERYGGVKHAVESIVSRLPDVVQRKEGYSKVIQELLSVLCL